MDETLEHTIPRNQQTLRVIYKKRDEIEPSVQEELLYSTIEKHLEHSHGAIQNWIAVHKRTITSSIKRAATRAIQGMRSIKSYFATARPPGRRHSAAKPPPQGIADSGGTRRDGLN